MTPQPRWSDPIPLDQAGWLSRHNAFVRVDLNGWYDPEVVASGLRIEVPRCKQYITSDGTVMLIPASYSSMWRYPPGNYDEWFTKDLHLVAQHFGHGHQEMRDWLCSEDVKQRAYAYLLMAQYHGFENFGAGMIYATDGLALTRLKEGPDDEEGS